MDEEEDECETTLTALSNALIVDASELQDEFEGSFPTAMEIDPHHEYDDDYDTQRQMENAAIITRIEDLRNVTSQYLRGDLTCTEYAMALEGLVDEEEEEEDPLMTLEATMTPIPSSSANASQQLRMRQIGRSIATSLASEETDLESASSPAHPYRMSTRNSNAGFYGSGATPTTFKIFGRRKLAPTLQRLIGAAHVRYAQGDHKSAIDMCMEIIKEQPTCVEPFQTLSMIYENQGRKSKSLQFALIAGLLCPRNCSEWPKLGEMSFEEANFPQAIMCYTQAIKVEPRNPDIYKRRCELMDLYGDSRGALKAYAQVLILFPEQAPLCIHVLRKMARIYFDGRDVIKAYETLSVAFNDHFKSEITSEEVNLMLELCISLKKYVEAFEIIVDHAGIQLIPPVDPLAFCSRTALARALRSEEITCQIPRTMNVELLAKLSGILIHLEAFNLSEKLVSILKTSDANIFGDLYLDVAEAYMAKQNFGLALSTLVYLIKSNKFNVAAVWLRYAECLFLMQRLEEAARAYEKVVSLAPNHTLAKLNLSIILQRLGRADDALETLAQADKEEDPLDPTLLIERCNILLKSHRILDFINTAKVLLSRHSPQIRNLDEAQVIIFATNKTRKRYEALQMDRRLRNEVEDDNIPHFLDKKTSLLSEWQIYLTLCRTLVDLERYDLLCSVAYSVCASKLFSKNAKMEKICEMHCFYATVMTGDMTLLPIHVRILLNNFPHSRRVLNMFSMTLQRSENENRFGRHVLRLLMKRPNDARLLLLNAHISFVTGTYKNALMEYTTLFAETPNNPIIPLMIASTLIHIQAQKTATSRAQIGVNVIAFMKKYMELRGSCQEAFYNMGRAMHAIGFLPLATQYYKLVLTTKPVRSRTRSRKTVVLEGTENCLDLKREAAFNLAQIYRAAGNHHLARFYLFKYIQV